MVSRRRFLLSLGAAGLVGAGACADTFAVEPFWLDVAEVPWPVPGLPASAEGMRVAHVTDAHVRAVARQEWNVLESLRRADCQVAVLTGDLVDRPWFLPPARAFIQAIRARVPQVLSVFGNWEHMAGVPIVDIAAAYRDAGVLLLRNESAVIEGVRFVGGDDDVSGFARHGECAGQVRPGETAFYLSHSPGFLSVAPPPRRYAGIFSGHTHGGQAQILGYSPYLPPGSGPYRAGRYDTAWGPLYVSRGTGTTSIHGRFLCRPELPVYTLRRA